MAISGRLRQAPQRYYTLRPRLPSSLKDRRALLWKDFDFVFGTVLPRITCVLTLSFGLILPTSLPAFSRLDCVYGYLFGQVLGDPGSGVALTQETAQSAVDSLLKTVSRIRNLKSMRPVGAQVISRDQVRARLDEIALEDDMMARLADKASLFKHLGMIPEDLDLFQLYKDIMSKELAGFYDINGRRLYLADWLPAHVQHLVATHEVTHALQDQHFSLRVRKKLGFDSDDARVAWHALIEGDATAVMIQAEGQRELAEFATASLDTTLPALPASGIQAPVLDGVPEVIRSMVLFPYVYGIRFVAALHQAGGWRRVDDAYIQIPASTEQILHPERCLGPIKDAPIQFEVPDLRGILAGGHKRVLEAGMGEFDVFLFLRKFLDPEIAKVASEGWGGCKVSVYGESKTDPDVVVINTIWDTEDDALQFFGSMIGVEEMRFPEQTGWPEKTSPNLIVWKRDEDARRVNVLRFAQRSVTVLENVPTAAYFRLITRLEQTIHYNDPTPEVRASSEDQLPWHQKSEPLAEVLQTIAVELPDNWTSVSLAKPPLVLEARRAGARLRILADPNASDPLGLDGYTHQLAFEEQKKGSNTYVQIDIDYPRSDVKIYQNIFSQLEQGRQVIYYIAGVDLGQGFGYVMIEQPNDGSTPDMKTDFHKILDELQLVTTRRPALNAVLPPIDTIPQGDR